jgi:deoxyribose-phosphate aldolase
MSTTHVNPTQFGSTALPEERVRQAIDHTKLTFKPDEAPEAAIRKLCREAVSNRFFAVCVRPQHIGLAKAEIAEAPVKVATVIGFPADKVEKAAEASQPTVGNFTTAEKVAETRAAVDAGVDELDLVINVGRFKEEAAQAEQPYTLQELIAVRDAAQGRPVKVIIETDLLNDAEIVKATQLCHQAGVFMVKTCTGMVNGGSGATLPIVTRIQTTLAGLNSPLQIKASGGIKTLNQANELIHAGANRLGTSAGVEIVAGLTSQQDY